MGLDSSRNMFQNSSSCTKYNSMSSIHWYNWIFHRSNCVPKNSFEYRKSIGRHDQVLGRILTTFTKWVLRFLGWDTGMFQFFGIHFDLWKIQLYHSIEFPELYLEDEYEFWIGSCGHTFYWARAWLVVDPVLFSPIFSNLCVHRHIGTTV